MPPRRSHKKSRQGCHRCKQRKIKCDEIHPTCGNCAKHGVACDFEGQQQVVGTPGQATMQRQSSEGFVARSPTTSSPTSSSTMVLYHSPDPSLSIPSCSPATHTLELRLLHNYTALTSKTLAVVDKPGTYEAWQLAVPSMAFASPCLMHAILAVSALHLRALNPSDQTLINASHKYIVSAISQYSSCLASGVTASNAEALFTTSALIAFQASASRRFQNDDRDLNGQEGYNLPIQWFHSFQGVKAVVLMSWQWLRESDRVRPIIQTQPALALDFTSDRPKFFSGLLEGLDEQLAGFTDESSRLDTRKAYEHSVAYLNWTHQKPDRARILGFPATVSRRFVELIMLQDPRALVIIACFFAMTRAVDDIWWLEGVARMEVDGIFSLLPPEWHARMDWPVRVTRWEGLMNEETWGGRITRSGAGLEGEEEEEVGGSLEAHIDFLAQLAPAVE